MFAMRGRRYLVLAAIAAATVAALFLWHDDARASRAKSYVNNMADKAGVGASKAKQAGPSRVRYLAEPTWTPPPTRDPFPALSAPGGRAPAVPAWNRPAERAHERYGLDYAPPLLIGFTRSWPVLLQAVVSYIAAGWPPEGIWVVENTGGGAHRANARGLLTMQNPLFLDHAALGRLGVRVVGAPVLLSFAQLQNYYTSLAHEHRWPYYFWSHMDVLVLSLEDGLDGVTPPARRPGYRSVYELCLAELQRSRAGPEPWSNVFFSYDHLSLVNREAYDDVGGWDPFIPYYMNDCDMHSRLSMRNWTQRNARSSIVTDVSAVLDDLRALYRDPEVEPAFSDPNPPPPALDGGQNRAGDQNRDRGQEPPPAPKPPSRPRHRQEARLAPCDPRTAATPDACAQAYYLKLKGVADSMFHHKHGDRGRNTWQLGQRGGHGEPYHYPARGLAEAVDVMTEAGREVFRRKWGHRDCDLLSGTQLRFDDQWRVAKDWE